MVYFLFLIVFFFSCPLICQQHDPDAEDIFQELIQKSSEYLNQAWEHYKNNHPDSPGTLGHCTEFTLHLTQELQKAYDAYTEFEKVRPNRITLEYAQRHYELEEKKNIINFALLANMQLQALLLKKRCEPKVIFLNR